MAHNALRPSVYVNRLLSPKSSVNLDKLRVLADSHGVRGVRFANTQALAITIMGSGEILGLYDYCRSQLLPEDATELGDLLCNALPPSADAYIEAPMTLYCRPAPSRTRPKEACIIMAPSDTVVAERAIAQEVVTDFVASRLGGIGILAESYTWRERLMGVRIANGHSAGALATFYEVLCEEAESIFPQTVLYEPVSVDDI